MRGQRVFALVTVEIFLFLVTPSSGTLPQYEITAASGSWKIKKLVCPEEVNWKSMDFSDGKIVWKEWNATWNPDLWPHGGWENYIGHIMQYDGNSISQISIDSVGEYDYPVTSQGNVAWRTFDRVKRPRATFYDNRTHSTQYLSDGTTFPSNHLTIYGQEVAWTCSGFSPGGPGGVWIYDGTDVNMITDMEWVGFYPSLGEAGLVWEGHADFADSEVYFYDGDFYKITDNEFGDTTPQISGHYLIWLHWPTLNTYLIRFYDLESDTMLDLTEESPNGWVHKTRHSMLNNRVTWMEYNYSTEEYNIMYFDGETTTCLGNGWWPSISERGIVWYSYDGNDEEIYFFDWSVIHQITDNDLDDNWPIIDQNYIVWWGKNSEHGEWTRGDIYIAELPKSAIRVTIDIKPGSCPNPLNVKSSGVLPVAILGTADFDANTVDAKSVRLVGVEPLRSNIEDVAAPVLDNNDCNCTEEGPDGIPDLTLKFETQAIVEAIGHVNDGDILPLTLTGVLRETFGGTPIEGADCVRIIKKSKK